MVDYFAILSKAIHGNQSTSARARAETYGIARAALRKELTLAGLDLTGDKAQQELAALERAILGVEVSISQNGEGGAALERLREKQRKRAIDQGEVASDSAPSESQSREVVILPPRRGIARTDHFHLDRPRRSDLPPYEGKNVTIFTLPAEVRKPPSLGESAVALFSEALRMTFVAMAAVALYVVVSEHYKGGENRTATSTTEAGQAGALHRPVPTGMPKPAVYGVYAIHDGQLIELNPVATVPVDPRTQDRFSSDPA